MNLKNCIVDKVSTLKDDSIKITLITRALSPEQMAQLFFSVNKEILAVDIDEEVKEWKSPSQRLRAVLYRLWERSDKTTYPEFELYYKAKMERVIESLKEKL